MADTYRIAIVGSGPAGMSAAAHAAKLGISHILLEKTDHLSDTIFKYQKGKHVMATPSQRWQSGRYPPLNPPAPFNGHRNGLTLRHRRHPRAL